MREGKPHVRFEVAGDGNQDMVWVIEALSTETERKQAARPKSPAPSPDPTSRPAFGGVVNGAKFANLGYTETVVQLQTRRTAYAPAVM